MYSEIVVFERKTELETTSEENPGFELFRRIEFSPTTVVKEIDRMMTSFKVNSKLLRIIVSSVALTITVTIILKCSVG